MKKIALGLGLLFSASTLASNIAIIDSGIDMIHKDIAPKALLNTLETPNNFKDEDRNGYPDDIFGWNFAEDNNKVIDYKYLLNPSKDIKLFLTIQAKIMRNAATAKEVAWLEKASRDQAFLGRMSVYNNFMHGTHVAGIATKDARRNKVFAIKMIPTEVSTSDKSQAFIQSLGPAKQTMLFTTMIAKQALDELAKNQSMLMEKIGRYVDDRSADIANASFGTGYQQGLIVSAIIYVKLFGELPSSTKNHTLARHFLQKTIEHSSSLVTSAPNTLFVFAAGNDGSDNDKYTFSPSNIKADNTISVAATMGRYALAPFSNYGQNMVDVAAPGVGIISTSPGNDYVQVSGTSQAAPYVTNIAGQVKDANPSLSPVDIKTIIMGTVDYKRFLTGKVLSGGVVNMGRAVQAARLSNSRNLEYAIKLSRIQVADVSTNNSLKSLPNVNGSGYVIPMPSMFKF